jgi:ABC-type multidrug transport system ATPase subunit
MAKLEIHQLTKQYGDHIVLDQLSIKTDCTILGISGPNGSGKSTLLRCIAGLLKPNSGRVTLTTGNRELTPADLNGEVGYTAPYVELYEGMSVTENLQFVRDLKRVKNTGGHPDIGQLLARCQAGLE